MVRRLAKVLALTATFMTLGATAASACGGLVAAGHAEVLRRATTMAAWHDGYEHYVTGFQFAGTARSFGYIIPLPAVPSKIEKGGEWTLERLTQEIRPNLLAFRSDAFAAAESVEVLQEVRIDALDITIVRGGGRDVAAWATKNGFDLTADTPQVLGGYGSSGAIFALARFDAVAAQERGLVEGQGTVIHFTVPLEAPWVPLRILALGKHEVEEVQADLFVLTEDRPSFFPDVRGLAGVKVVRSLPATKRLLADLRSDKGMGWLPASGMWFTALEMNTTAGTIDYDLSIDGGGPPEAPPPASVPVPRIPPIVPGWAWWLGAAGLATALVAGVRRNVPVLRRAGVRG